ncbi:DUF2277 family protein [Oerskovia sp. M15]
MPQHHRPARLEPPATDEEIQAAALQFVRKVAGIQSVSAATREPIDAAVAGIAAIVTQLLADLPERRQPPSTVPAAPGRGSRQDRRARSGRGRARTSTRAGSRPRALSPVPGASGPGTSRDPRSPGSRASVYALRVDSPSTNPSALRCAAPRPRRAPRTSPSATSDG